MDAPLRHSWRVTIGTVVLLPPAQLPGAWDEAWPTRRELAAELMAYGVNVYVVPQAPPVDQGLDLRTATAHWVAHNAMALTADQPERPILLVAFGAAGALMQALGFSQKASRRPVAGYVVVDGALPKAGAGDWPDAPITYISTSTADDLAATAQAARDTLHQAELRGWTTAATTDPGIVIRNMVDG